MIKLKRENTKQSIDYIKLTSKIKNQKYPATGGFLNQFLRLFTAPVI